MGFAWAGVIVAVFTHSDEPDQSNQWRFRADWLQGFGCVRLSSKVAVAVRQPALTLPPWLGALVLGEVRVGH